MTLFLVDYVGRIITGSKLRLGARPARPVFAVSPQSHLPKGIDVHAQQIDQAAQHPEIATQGSKALPDSCAGETVAARLAAGIAPPVRPRAGIRAGEHRRGAVL